MLLFQPSLIRILENKIPQCKQCLNQVMITHLVGLLPPQSSSCVQEAAPFPHHRGAGRRVICRITHKSISLNPTLVDLKRKSNSEMFYDVQYAHCQG